MAALRAVLYLRVRVQKLLERNELVRDTLDKVHPVDAEHERLAVEAALQLDHLP